MNDCIFCRIVAGDAESWKVHETDRTLAFFALHPVNDYHALVIPKAHHATVLDTPEPELLAVMSAIQQVVELYDERLGLRDLQIVSSNGAAAQQDVFHLHFHVVPRHEGDGQDLSWTPRPDSHERFDELLARLR